MLPPMIESWPIRTRPRIEVLLYMVTLSSTMAWFVYGVALCVVVEVACAESHALVEHDVVANHRCFAYHNACAVVYGEVFTNLGGRVYVDAGG